MKDLMTQKEVMALLRISRSTLHEMRAARTLPFLKVGGRVRFRREDIEAWINEKMVRMT